MPEGASPDSRLLVDAEPVPRLVSLREYGFQTLNYYWSRREFFELSESQLAEAGVTGEDILVRAEVADALCAVRAEVEARGYEMLVKEGYRAPLLYELIQQRWIERWGEERASKLLNLEDMPHATGLVVDIALLECATGQEVEMRNKEHDSEGGQFIGFYTNHPDPNAARYEELQSFLIDVMQRAGFRIGKKREYWHFEFGNIADAELLDPPVAR